MMRRRRQPRGITISLVSLAVSAAIHLLVAFPLKRLVESYLSPDKPGERPVKVVRVPAEEWSRRFESAAARRPPVASVSKNTVAKDAAPRTDKAPDSKKKDEPTKPDRQVVDVPPTADDSPNPNAKFLSKSNTHVEKQSVARLEERDPRKRRVSNRLQTREEPKPAVPPSLLTPGLSIKGDGLEADSAAKAGGTKEAELKLPSIARRDAVKLGFGIDRDPLAIPNRNASDGLLGNSNRLELNAKSALGEEDGEQGGNKGSTQGSDKEQALPTIAALVPNLGRPSALSGSPSMDHIEGVPEGEGTFLNTKEFKYATFIHRVSESVYPFWDSYLHTEYRRRDPTRRIYGQKDRSTTVSLAINLEGEVADLHVSASSGVDFLDDVIVRAIKQAQPFPNPPAAMADDDGLIRLNYRFVVVLRPSGGLF